MTALRWLAAAIGAALLAFATTSPAPAYEVTTISEFPGGRLVAAGPTGTTAAVGYVWQNPDDGYAYLSGIASLPCSLPAPWGIRVTTSTMKSLVFAPDGSVIWVVSEGNVTAISTTTCLPVGASITLPTPVHSVPFGVAISPDGATLFITNILSHSIVIIDTRSRTVTREVALAWPLYDEPGGIAVSPNGATVYFTAQSGDAVGYLSAADAFVSVTSVALGTPFAHPRQVAFAPDGRRAYIAEERGVTIVDAATHAALETISFSLGIASALALSPDGTRLYVPVLNAAPLTMAVIDTATRTIVDSIPLPGALNVTELAVAASGTYAWVTDLTTDKLLQVRLGPGAPTGVSAVGTNSTLTIAYTAGSDNGASITGYEYSVDGGAWTNAGTSGTRFTVTGLTPATTYSVRVRALNGQAPGEPSAAISGATLAAVPTTRTARVARPRLRMINGKAVLITQVITTSGGVIRQSAMLRTRGSRALCRVSRRVTKAGTYRLSCALGRRDRAALRTRALTAVVTTTFTPTTGAAASATSTVKIPRWR